MTINLDFLMPPHKAGMHTIVHKDGTIEYWAGLTMYMVFTPWPKDNPNYGHLGIGEFAICNDDSTVGRMLVERTFVADKNERESIDWVLAMLGSSRKHL